MSRAELVLARASVEVLLSSLIKLVAVAPRAARAPAGPGSGRSAPTATSESRCSSQFSGVDAEHLLI